MSRVERIQLADGYSIARVLNGCWQLTPDHRGGPGSETETHRIFAELVDRGFTTFDCADIYIGVEESLGRFRRTLANPDSIQIHTKYAANRESLAELTNQKIDAAVDRSLTRLGVERLDLLQYHWWNYDVAGLENLTERLVRAQDAGKIRLLGLTNFNTEHTQKIIESGANIVSLQSQYSLLDRRPEKAMTDLCARTGVHILPYGVLAGGFLSEKYHGANAPSDMNRSLQKYRLIIKEVGGWEAFQALLRGLSTIATKHNSTIDVIATRWMLDQPSVAAVILGVGHKSRAQKNLALFDLALDDEDRQAIADILSTLSIPPGDMFDIERDMAGRHSKLIKMNLHNAAGNE